MNTDNSHPRYSIADAFKQLEGLKASLWMADQRRNAISATLELSRTLGAGIVADPFIGAGNSLAIANKKSIIQTHLNKTLGLNSITSNWDVATLVAKSAIAIPNVTPDAFLGAAGFGRPIFDRTGHFKKYTRSSASKAVKSRPARPLGKLSLEMRLRAFDARLAAMWEGALFVLSVQYSERSRHFCISIRELLTELLHLMAPDEKMRLWTKDPVHFKDDRPTREARLLYIGEQYPAARNLSHQYNIREIPRLIRSLNKGAHTREIHFFPLHDLWLMKESAEKKINLLLAIYLDYINLS